MIWKGTTAETAAVLFSLSKYTNVQNSKEGGDVAGKNTEKQLEAERLYRQGEKLVDIAHRLNIPEGTIRSWKNRLHWDCNVADGKCNVAKSNAAPRRAPKEQPADDVRGICENGKLTDKQQLFCLYYVKCFNATKAYQKAYGCSYEAAAVNGSNLLKNTKIKAEILNLKQNRFNRELLHEDDIFQKYMDIAFADITDYVEFGNKEIDILNEVTGEPDKIKVSYLNVKDSCEVDGTLITEISKIKGEVNIKLADRMQALKWLADHMDIATEEQRARIAVLKAKDTDNSEEGNELEDWIDFVNTNGNDDGNDDGNDNGKAGEVDADDGSGQ
jgi:phage terminase small subunit